jgi:hypothetical protein
MQLIVFLCHERHQMNCISCTRCNSFMCNHICMQLMQLYYNFTKTTFVIAMQLLCKYSLQLHVDVAFHPSMIMNCVHFHYNSFAHFYFNILFKNKLYFLIGVELRV